jgi:2,4-diaminopentanoate dehydrogenase C-terminal domain
VTRVVCAGLDPLRDEVARRVGEIDLLECVGVIDDGAAPPEADVAIVMEPDPETARRLAAAALGRGCAVILVAREPGWITDTELGGQALRAGRPLLAYRRDGAFLVDLVPAALALACVRVDRVEVELRSASETEPHGDLSARLRLHGEPSLEVELTGAVTDERALAGLTVNAIPLLLAAPPGLHTLVDLPPVAARNAEATEPV